jgi:hypothetical protein
MASNEGGIRMTSARASASSAVPQLMTTIRQLTPAELPEFKRQFAEWQNQNGERTEEETGLVQVCRTGLPAADTRRLKQLIGKSERGTLTALELEEYRALVRRAEKLDGLRLGALTLLARLWGKPARVVMESIGWESGEDYPC